MTELLYAADAYLKEVDAVVQEIRDGRGHPRSDRLLPTGGGQPHDTGTLTWTDADWQRRTSAASIEVKRARPGRAAQDRG